MQTSEKKITCGNISIGSRSTVKTDRLEGSGHGRIAKWIWFPPWVGHSTTRAVGSQHWDKNEHRGYAELFQKIDYVSPRAAEAGPGCAKPSLWNVCYALTGKRKGIQWRNMQPSRRSRQAHENEEKHVKAKERIRKRRWRNETAKNSESSRKHMKRQEKDETMWKGRKERMLENREWQDESENPGK